MSEKAEIHAVHQPRTAYSGVGKQVREESSPDRDAFSTIPYIERAYAVTEDAQVLDLGCGRGEWLALLKEKGYAGKGVDSIDTEIIKVHKIIEPYYTGQTSIHGVLSRLTMEQDYPVLGRKA